MGEEVHFQEDPGGACFILTSFSGKFFRFIAVIEVERITSQNLFIPALTCQFERRMFKHQFLVVAQCPTPWPGRDLFAKLRVILSFWQRPKWILPIRMTSGFADLISQ